MTTEEKAKAYDEALEKAKSMIDDLRKGEDILAVSDLESMFPELKESEGERIRKELIAFLKENYETGRAEETWSLSGIERWIAWLEKQKEQKPTEEIPSNVDLEKEIEKAQEHYFALKDKGFSLDSMDVSVLARHFYELGIKEQTKK